MVRYPHTLTISYRSEGSYDDSTGDFTAGTEVQEIVTGRAEANGKGSLIRTEDGAQIVYDWQFYAKRQDFEAPFNSKAVLKKGSDTIWEGTVKRHAPHQTGAQIWL